MPEPTWTKRYGEGILISSLATAACALIAYLFHQDSPWARPVFYGLISASLPLMIYFCLVITRRIPKQKITPSIENIETFVRTWLDNHKVTVKVDPHQDFYFRYRITLDSGCYLTVVRSRLEYKDYVQILCDLGMRGDDQKLLEQFSEQERIALIFDIQMELARAKVGYSGLVYPPQNFILFQRVPIYPTLNEFVFMNMIGNVEAARNLVAIVFLKARSDKVPTILPSASPTPKLESPKS